MKKKIFGILAGSFTMAAVAALFQISLNRDLTFDDLRAEAASCVSWQAVTCVSTSTGNIYYNHEVSSW